MVKRGKFQSIKVEEGDTMSLFECNKLRNKLFDIAYDYKGKTQKEYDKEKKRLLKGTIIKIMELPDFKD